MSAAFALAADLGSVQLYRAVPETPPAVRAVRAISHGAQYLAWYREARAPRRAAGIPGVWEQFSGGFAPVNLEAFGETAEQLQAAIARYLKSYPNKEFRTHFAAAQTVDGEHVARGSRSQERIDWQ